MGILGDSPIQISNNVDQNLLSLLKESAKHHNHLCPRQVLGVRIGLAGIKRLGIETSKGERLLVIAETDGCFISGIEAATGTSVRHRTLRVEDYGKVAATFIDIQEDYAVRIAPRLDVRKRAWYYAQHHQNRQYFAMLQGYQVMPEEELLNTEDVELRRSVSKIVSRAGVRVICDCCGEEIFNEREIVNESSRVCRSCAGESYYKSG